MRNWHYLHASRAVGWPQQSIALSVVTTEPDPEDEASLRFQPTLLGWAAVCWMGAEGRAERIERADGICAADWWRWLDGRLRRGRATWIWQLHACAGMTVLGLFDMLTKREWIINGADQRTANGAAEHGPARGGGLCVVSDPPTILLARPADRAGSAHWLDLRNLYPRATWDAIAPPTDSLPEHQGDPGVWRNGRGLAVLRADALGTWLTGWYSAVRELRLGGLRMTAASQSWHGWRTNYLTCPVECHNDPERLRAEREAIYGGRNEVFRLHAASTAVRELDAPGYYPALASTHALPGRIARRAGHDRHGAADAAADGYLVIARGRVYTDTPCLPYRGDDCTIYPIGAWRGTYCWPEWELLWRRGGRADIERWWAYEPARPFARYFGTLRDARRQAQLVGARARESAIKLLANALIGRCAAANRVWADVPGVSHHCAWDEWPHIAEDGRTLKRRRALAWRVQELVEDGPHPESVPALAAWVYSLGRVQLYHWMEIAGHDEIYYADTDSLWTSERGYDRLATAGALDSAQLVRLRLVERHAWARFRGHKHYETPAGLVCAGVPRAPVSAGGNGWRQWRGQSPGEAARARMAPLPDLIAHDIADRAPYRGGRLGADGRVYPLEVWDE